MTTPTDKPKWLPERRGWTAQMTAHYIGVSIGWFMLHKDTLFKKHGFPVPSPVTGKYDGRAVSKWYDAHSNLQSPGATVDPSEGWRQGLESLAEDHGQPAH